VILRKIMVTSGLLSSLLNIISIGRIIVAVLFRKLRLKKKEIII
jgi:hypothetical protein